MKFVKKLLPHAVIVLCIIVPTFLVLDLFNPNMNFTGNPVSKILLAVLCLLSAANAVLSAHYNG